MKISSFTFAGFISGAMVTAAAGNLLLSKWLILPSFIFGILILYKAVQAEKRKLKF